METNEESIETKDMKPSERMALLEQRFNQLQAVCSDLVMQHREMALHRHDSTGAVLVPPRLL